MIPRRIRVVGVSGSGKSRLASQIAARSGLARLELDAVFWGADWTFRDLDEARELVREFVAAHPEGWVIDGNWHSRLNGMLDPGTPGGGDLVVWLDHPRSIVMRRVVSRTLGRGVLRRELWHGNRERPSTWLSRDPDTNIMLWSWTQHAPTREHMLAYVGEGWPVLRLQSQRAVDAWLATLG
ncbi:toxin [Microbacterium sp. SS28]|uniref:toxin n=1 Tax=Microbacterium sp. SS28 TaxID=2919948 RepID=UPI001FAB0981|nr:toxin [Microbacterium sp. SS28]